MRYASPPFYKSPYLAAKKYALLSNTHNHTYAFSQLQSVYRRNLPPQLVALGSHQGQTMFRDSLIQGSAMSFFPLIQQFMTQSLPTTCSSTSMAMVLNALKIDPGVNWKGIWRWYDDHNIKQMEARHLSEGMNLFQFHQIIQHNHAHSMLFVPEHTYQPQSKNTEKQQSQSTVKGQKQSPTIAQIQSQKLQKKPFNQDKSSQSNISLQKFSYKHISQSFKEKNNRNPSQIDKNSNNNSTISNSNQRITDKKYKARTASLDFFRAVAIACSRRTHTYLTVNFHRPSLRQTGSGHFSPIAAYHSSKDMVLMLDVAKFKYDSYWCSTQALYNSLKPIDKDTGTSRGFLINKKKYGEGGNGQPDSALCGLQIDEPMNSRVRQIMRKSSGLWQCISCILNDVNTWPALIPMLYDYHTNHPPLLHETESYQLPSHYKQHLQQIASNRQHLQQIVLENSLLSAFCHNSPCQIINLLALVLQGQSVSMCAELDFIRRYQLFLGIRSDLLQRTKPGVLLGTRTSVLHS